MSGIARILVEQGLPVSGSDARDSRRVAALRALGAQVWIGHDASHIAEADTVVFSTAIRDTNPELVEARARGLRIMNRATALATIIAQNRVVAIAGTHGKTTTTSMLTVALQQCGADPSFVIGGELNESGSNAHLGSGDLFVVEADESDGTFLQLGAAAGIVTNIEPDHLDHWGTLEAIHAGFDRFAAGIAERGGFVVACVDDPGAASFTSRCRANGIDVRTYGASPEADFRIEVVATSPSGWDFRVVRGGVRSTPIRLRVPGGHNVMNATAALVCGVGLGFAQGELSAGLARFSGTRRRFEFRGEAGGVRVYDDYAHLPTEISTTLKAARELQGDKRVLIVFQPARYHRTAVLMNELGESLGGADEVVVLEVFSAGGDPIPGASGKGVAAAVPLPPDMVTFEPSWSRVAGVVADRARPGDIVMTFGCGDVGLLCPEILAELEQRASRSGASVEPASTG